MTTMTMNEEAVRDLRGYVTNLRWLALVLLVIILMALFFVWYFEYFTLVPVFLGIFLGAAMACANIFCLGFAFFVLAIKNGKKLVILWPLASFFLMCLTAFFMANRYEDTLFGFALGLTVPVILGAGVIFLSSKPA